MQILLVISLHVMLAIHLAAATCPPGLADLDYAAKFCQADVVFKGRAVSGVSSVAIDTDGSTITSARHDFRVSKYYKDNTGRRRRVTPVSRMYTQRDPCDSAFLNADYNVHLVFARGNDSLSVPACGAVIPWPCVPRRARQALATQTC